MPTPSIDWNDYRCFLAVAETHSLSAAARRLQVAQPTVGRRLKALEARLNARLFERLGHRYALTTAGENIRSLVDEMERESLSIERRVAALDGRLSGSVRIATTESLAACWLAPKLPRLQSRHPELIVELVTGTAPANLLRREADLALRVGHPGAAEVELAGRRIGGTNCGLYGAASYLARHGEPRALSELQHHAIIESVREIAELPQARALRATEARVALHCNNIGVQIAAAEAGFGLLALTSYMLAGTTGLRRVLADAFDMTLEVWLLTHEDLQSTARIRAVIDFLTREVRRDCSVFTVT